MLSKDTGFRLRDDKIREIKEKTLNSDQLSVQVEQLHDKNPNVTITLSSGGEDHEWDLFVLDTPDGHHEQTSLWSMVKEVYGWKPLRIVVKECNRICGGIQVLLRTAGAWGTFAYVSRGPVIGANREALLGPLLQKLHRKLLERRVIYIALVPPYSGHVYDPVLRGFGYSFLPQVLPPTGVMTATSILDLDQDIEDILRRMRRKTRQHIKKGLQAGISVREGDGKEIPTFQKLMLALCERRGVLPTPPQKNFFEHLWRIFSPYGFVKLFVAEHKGQIISAIIAFTYGSSLKVWKIGWSGQLANLYPNEVLYWEIIRWAKDKGYRQLDFVYIDRMFAENIIYKKGDNDKQVDGISFFKIGFGGNVMLLPKPYWCCFNPLLRFFLRIGGEKILHNDLSVVRRVVNRIGRGLGN